MEDSPLGRLPPELRNQIYELVLRPTPENGALLIRELYREFGLLQTCRQLRSETLPLCFTLHKLIEHCTMLQICRERLGRLFNTHGAPLVAKISCLTLIDLPDGDSMCIESAEVTGVNTTELEVVKAGDCARISEIMEGLYELYTTLGLELAINPRSNAMRSWPTQKYFVLKPKMVQSPASSDLKDDNDFGA